MKIILGIIAVVMALFLCISALMVIRDCYLSLTEKGREQLRYEKKMAEEVLNHVRDSILKGQLQGKEFVILTSTSKDNLEDMVCRAIRLGYQPVGSFFTDGPLNYEQGVQKVN